MPWQVLAPDAVVGDLLLGAQRRLDRAALGLEAPRRRPSPRPRASGRRGRRCRRRTRPSRATAARRGASRRTPRAGAASPARRAAASLALAGTRSAHSITSRSRNGTRASTAWAIVTRSQRWRLRLCSERTVRSSSACSSLGLGELAQVVVAGEQLVGALAGEHDAHVLARHPREHVVRHGAADEPGVERLDRAHDAGQRLERLGGRVVDLVVVGAEELGHAAGGREVGRVRRCRRRTCAAGSRGGAPSGPRSRRRARSPARRRGTRRPGRRPSSGARRRARAPRACPPAGRRPPAAARSRRAPPRRSARARARASRRGRAGTAPPAVCQSGSNACISDAKRTGRRRGWAGSSTAA